MGAPVRKHPSSTENMLTRTVSCLASASDKPTGIKSQATCALIASRAGRARCGGKYSQIYLNADQDSNHLSDNRAKTEKRRQQVEAHINASVICPSGWLTNGAKAVAKA